MIFVLCGPGGVGKGTVAGRLIECVENLSLSRSWTTRTRRENESASAYVFVDEESFISRVADHGFIEYARFLDNFYGTPLPEERFFGCESHLLLEIDVQGAKQIRELIASATIMVLTPPSDSELERRLRIRGDDQSHIAARVALANSEIESALALGGQRFINDDLEAVVAEIAGFIETCIGDCHDHP